MTPGPRQQIAGFALLLGLLAAGILLVTRFLAIPWVVLGDSMEPTLQPGDRVLVDLWTFRQRGPRPGEIVLFRGPLPGEAVLIKRVVAAPPEPRRGPRADLWPERAGPPHGLIWVRGDNAARSLDSRSFGPVPVGRVQGRIVCRYWPPSRAGPIR